MLVLLLAACTANLDDSAPIDSGMAPRCQPRPSLGAPASVGPRTLDEPTWTATGDQLVVSSPRFADLDGQGPLDITFGRGTEDGGPDLLHGVGGAVALDGSDGTPLWDVDARQQVFATAALVDLSADGRVDAVYGGRHNELFAVNGATGDVLWRSALEVEAAREAGLYNNYSPVVVHDVDGDGVVDLLVANGGDSTQPPASSNRPPAQLLLVSGADGSILRRATVPDLGETYMSPIVVDDAVIFGTGGETRPGSLWRAPLAAVEAEDLSGAVALATGSAKGFIAPPSRAPWQLDGCDQVVASSFEGHLLALDRDGQELWRVSSPGHETYTTPVLGYFDDDEVPDVFATFQAGTWPAYSSSRSLAVSGADGTVLWEATGGAGTTSGNVVADLNGDGLDEVIYGVTGPGAGGLAATLFVFDPVARSSTAVAQLDTALVASPLLGDADMDGDLELVVVATDLASDNPDWAALLYDTDWPAEGLRWGAYLGTDGDGAL